jgi:hypothetical protein
MDLSPWRRELSIFLFLGSKFGGRRLGGCGGIFFSNEVFLT